MKNKLIYLVAVLLTVCTCYSCSDDDDKDTEDLTGTWKYENCHLVFDYQDANIQLPEGVDLGFINPALSGLTAVPANLAAGFLKEIANDKMSDYFTGIKFVSNSELEIMMTMDGKAASLKAAYVVQNNVIGVTIDKDALEKIAQKEINIPEISLIYKFEDRNLIMYLNKVAVQGMLQTMLPMLVNQIKPDATPAEIAGITAYVTGVMNKTNTLEFGVILKR